MENKPNPFVPTYCFVEEQLQFMALQLKDVEGNSTSELFELHKAIKATLHAIERQLAKTKTVVLPALAVYEPGVVQAFADNHAGYQVLGMKIQELTNSLLYSTALLEKATLAAALIHHFNKYSITIHETLSRQEGTLLPLLQRYLNDKELGRMQVQLEQRHYTKIPTSLTAELVLN